jgi:ABC-type dipeptide/oligopeptide/nickel transport system permease component
LWNNDYPLILFSILISTLIVILSLSIASLLRYNHYTKKILLGDF